MDPRKNMIIDLEKKGDKRMFVTEQVVQISENNNGLWAVEFSTSQRIFNYNKSRLLYLTNPISVDLIEKGFYITIVRFPVEIQIKMDLDLLVKHLYSL